MSEKLKDSWFYNEYNGKKMYVPSEPFYRPQPVFLQHHRENVFETFRQIRRNYGANTQKDTQEVHYDYAAEQQVIYGWVTQGYHGVLCRFDFPDLGK